MQTDLFAEAEDVAAIPGLRYEPAFLSSDEEADLLDVIQTLPLHAARYKEYLARRQVVSFGGSYDFDTNTLLPGKPLDERLLPLRDRVARWLNVEPDALAQVLVAQYSPGTPLGWHRDVPDFETIAGVSLGNEAQLRFRPYPPDVIARLGFACSSESLKYGLQDLGESATLVQLTNCTQQDPPRWTASYIARRHALLSHQFVRPPKTARTGA